MSISFCLHKLTFLINLIALLLFLRIISGAIIFFIIYMYIYCSLNTCRWIRVKIILLKLLKFSFERNEIGCLVGATLEVATPNRVS